MAQSTLKMSDKIRIKIDACYKGIYNALKNNAVGEFHELFFICVCLGHKMKSTSPLKKREDCFWSNTILPDEWYAYYSIYLHDRDMDFTCLDSDEDVISAMQEYANAGMSQLIDEFLCDYINKDSLGNYTVEHFDHLPKELLVKLTMDWSA